MAIALDYEKGRIARALCDSAERGLPGSQAHMRYLLLPRRAAKFTSESNHAGGWRAGVNKACRCDRARGDWKHAAEDGPSKMRSVRHADGTEPAQGAAERTTPATVPGSGSGEAR